MAKNPISPEREKLTVHRGRLNSLNIYDITEDELEKLGKGGSESILLNFTIFALSVAITSLITLLNTNIELQRIYLFFLVVTILGFLSGIILLILWLLNRSSKKDLIKKIKNRLGQNDLSSYSLVT